MSKSIRKFRERRILNGLVKSSPAERLQAATERMRDQPDVYDVIVMFLGLYSVPTDAEISSAHTEIAKQILSSPGLMELDIADSKFIKAYLVLMFRDVISVDDFVDPSVDEIGQALYSDDRTHLFKTLFKFRWPDYERAQQVKSESFYTFRM